MFQVLFSCKITKSIFTHLEAQGVDLDGVYERAPVPREFLLELSYWLEARQMEALLRDLDLQVGNYFGEDFIAESAHRAHQLKTWGALDSVLRMVSKPQDILLYPQRFLSYFVDPPPPLAKLHRDSGGISFEIPLGGDDYPLCSRFLLGAMESLPSFSGGNLFKGQWRENRVEIRWLSDQPSMLSAQDRGERSIRPELFQSILEDLQENQKKLEQSYREIIFKDREIELLKLEVQHLHQGNSRVGSSRAGRPQGGGGSPGATEALEPTFPQLRPPSQGGLSGGSLAPPVKTSGREEEGHLDLRPEVYRLSDYFTRSAQLVTLLVGQDRADRQVQEAMKRVDWAKVQEESPRILKGLLGALTPREETRAIRKKTVAKKTVDKKTGDNKGDGEVHLELEEDFKESYV